MNKDMRSDDGNKNFHAPACKYCKDMTTFGCVICATPNLIKSSKKKILDKIKKLKESANQTFFSSDVVKILEELL